MVRHHYPDCSLSTCRCEGEQWLCGWQSVDGALEDEAGPPRGAEGAGAEGADGPEGVGPVGQRRLSPVPGCPL